MERKLILCIFIIVFCCIIIAGIKYQEYFGEDVTSANDTLRSLNTTKYPPDIYASNVVTGEGSTVGKNTKFDDKGNVMTENVEADVIVGKSMYSTTLAANKVTSKKSISTQDLYTDKLCIGNSCLSEKDVNNLISERSPELVLERNDIFEFPPEGIASGNNWKKDMNDVVTGIHGINYVKFKTTMPNTHPYGGGEYIAWANSIWDYRHSDRMYEWEWPPSGAFDKRGGGSGKNSGWHNHHTQGYTNSSSNLKDPFYLAIKLPRKIVLRKYSLQTRADGCCPEQMPSAWTIEGSNNGSSWDVIDMRNNIGGWFNGSVREFSVNIDPKRLKQGFYLYEYYRIVIYRNSSPHNNFVHIGEWKLFGSPV